ncbi:MAG: hypothetical protein J5507_01400 [Clostridia bacterium]|nr:hypothetical protein [Clostridia bacterium]
MKNSKGITLIALVITIIVMLILVGVTINVASNSGLFGKAGEAKGGTNLAKEKEMMQAAALGYLNDDGYVDLGTFATEQNNKIEGYTLENKGTYVTAIKEDGTTFYVTNQGGITDEKPQTPAVTGYTLKANPGSVLQEVDSSSDVIEFINANSTELVEIGIEDDDNKYFINIVQIDLIQDYLICAYVYSLSDLTKWDTEAVSITGGSWNKITIGNEGPEAEVITSSEFPIFKGYLTEQNETLEVANDSFGEIFVLAQ